MSGHESSQQPSNSNGNPVVPMAIVAPMMSRSSPSNGNPNGNRPGEDISPFAGGQIPQQKRVFRPGSKLLAYLIIKLVHLNLQSRVEFVLTEVLTWLREIISRENQYDDTNPCIVICRPDLEDALNVAAMHVSEIRDRVCLQLVPMSDPISTVPMPERKTIPRRMPPPGPLLPRGSSMNIQQRETLVPHTLQVELTARFRIKEKFLAVLRTLPDMPQTQAVFTYEQVSKHLSAYILKNKQHFFDNRNIKVVLCDGDPLGDAFEVRSFHRTQVMTLLRTQLIPLDDPAIEIAPSPDTSSIASSGYGSMMSGDSAGTASNASNAQLSRNGSSTVVKNNSSSSTASSEPPRTAPSAPSTTQVFSVHHLPQPKAAFFSSSSILPVDRRRKRNPSGKDLCFDGASGPKQFSQNGSSSSFSLHLQQDNKRRRRSSTVIIMSKSDGGESSGIESVYSEQGYETVPIGTLRDEDDSNLESDSEEGGGSSIGRNRSMADLILEGNFTEYEVDSDADREEEQHRLGSKEVNGDSEDDTDVDEGTGKISITVVEIDSSHSSTWADSSSATDIEVEEVAPNRKKYYVKKDQNGQMQPWQCFDCRTTNLDSGAHYCSQCWQDRKTWIPRRSKPRVRARPKQFQYGKQKQKRTRGQPVKSSSSSLMRSLSHPGEATTTSQVPDMQEKGCDERSQSDVDDNYEENEERVRLVPNCSQESQDSAIGTAASSQETLNIDTSDIEYEKPKLKEPKQQQESVAEPTLKKNLSLGEFMSWMSSLDRSQQDELKSLSMEAVQMKYLERDAEAGKSAATSIADEQKTSELLCDYCLTRKKTAGMVHGKIVHQASCYPCAKKMYKQRLPCPICRRKIEKIVEVKIT